MSNRSRIDSLLLFLVLGLVFLWLLFPDIRESIFGNKHHTIEKIVFDQQLNYPKQGSVNAGKILPFNSELNLEYSTDGGQTFRPARNNELIIQDIPVPDLIYQNTSIRWRHPKGEFPKLTTTQVKLVDRNKNRESQVKTLTFFNTVPSDLPVVNITINQKDLFGWEKGIMIYGASSMEDSGFQKDWWYRKANFSSRGREWARNANFQFFEEGKLTVDQTCEIKISGNATRYFPQKSLKLYPLDESGKRTKMAYDFFHGEGNKKAKSLLLRQSGNDNNKTLFADLLMHQLAADSKVLVQNGFPVSVFINGNYWGIYNFRERIDDYFIAKKEDVSKKEVTILYCEVYGDRTILRSGEEHHKFTFDSLIAGLPTEALSIEEYEAIKKEISVKSFMDYIIFETYYANQDWLHNNTTWYKAGDKKWKWVLNDLDYSLAYPGEDNLQADLFEKLKNSQSITAQLFNALMTVPEFSGRFKERAHVLMDSNFTDENIELHFSDLKKAYETEIDQHIRRWRFIDSKETWEKDCQKNATFLRERRTIFLKQVDSL